MTSPPPRADALLFQHFPVGGEHDYVDDQAALLELIAGTTSGSSSPGTSTARRSPGWTGRSR